MCQFQHYNQSFLDQGTGTRDRDVRPVFWNQGMGGYQARGRTRNRSAFKEVSTVNSEHSETIFEKNGPLNTGKRYFGVLVLNFGY